MKPTVEARILADLESLADLPARSAVLGPLLRVLGREDVGFAEVELLVGREPVVAARVISAANAAAYAGYMPVTSLRAALMRLGLARVQRLALLASLYNVVPTPRRYHDAFCRHSLATSHAVEVVIRDVEAAHVLEPEQIGLAGLLHDLGLLVLVGHYPKDDGAVSALIKAEAMPRWAAEQKVLGIDHGAITAHLLEHWKIPGAITEPVRFHHHPVAAPAEHRVAAAVLRIADAAAGADAILDLGPHGEPLSEDGAVAELGVDADALDALLALAREESERVVAPAADPRS